jgi:hypothetical protein
VIQKSFEKSLVTGEGGNHHGDSGEPTLSVRGRLVALQNFSHMSSVELTGDVIILVANGPGILFLELSCFLLRKFNFRH